MEAINKVYLSTNKSQGLLMGAQTQVEKSACRKLEAEDDRRRLSKAMGGAYTFRKARVEVTGPCDRLQEKVQGDDHDARMEGMNMELLLINSLKINVFKVQTVIENFIKKGFLESNINHNFIELH